MWQCAPGKCVCVCVCVCVLLGYTIPLVLHEAMPEVSRHTLPPSPLAPSWKAVCVYTVPFGCLHVQVTLVDSSFHTSHHYSIPFTSHKGTSQPHFRNTLCKQILSFLWSTETLWSFHPYHITVPTSLDRSIHRKRKRDLMWLKRFVKGQVSWNTTGSATTQSQIPSNIGGTTEFSWTRIGASDVDVRESSLLLVRVGRSSREMPSFFAM